jgi:spore germination protein GerM
MSAKARRTGFFGPGLVGPGLVAAAALGLVWLFFVVLPRWSDSRSPAGQEASSVATARPGAAPAAEGQNIKANLFYVAEDGVTLTGVERDVPFGENTLEQAKAIVAAQLAPVAEPLVSAIPPGTTLRALFITSGGEAYVDLSRALLDGHPGGSTNELLTIYTVVDALTANLPAVRAVQLLVDGRELDTLAGHVDLRRPISRKLP